MKYIQYEWCQISDDYFQKVCGRLIKRYDYLFEVSIFNIRKSKQPREFTEHSQTSGTFIGIANVRRKFQTTRLQLYNYSYINSKLIE